jgi:AraC-like DNA-binding protein
MNHPSNEKSLKNSEPEEVVPLKYARTMLKVADAQGYEPRDLTDSLNLGFDIFDPNADPDSEIPASIYTAIYTRVMWLLQDESFGLNLKQRAPAGTFRMMSLTIIHCSDLEHALRRATEFNNFCNSLTGLPTDNTNPISRNGDGTAEYQFPSSSELVDIAIDDELISIAHCVAIWRRFSGWLIGKKMELLEVRFQAEQPENTSYLEQLFKCSVSFNQSVNTFRFPAAYLTAPLVHTEDSLKDFLRNAPYHLLASIEKDDTSIFAQMKRIVGNDFSRDFPSVVTMAGQLNMSVRTLRRRLKELGSTYQQFKDGLRKDAAMSFLNRPELKINAVSALLGFDEPSAFHRSFKKWTGLTPGEYRAKQ